MMHRRNLLQRAVSGSAWVLAATVAALFAVAPASTAQTKGFPDVPDTHWAADAVKQLAAAGVVRGYQKQPGAAQKPEQKYSGNKPVTRYELAVTLYRFLQYVQRADKKKGSTALTAPPKDGAEAVKRLIAGGYLPASTPLAKSGTTPVTANQVGDALAAILRRVSERKTPVTPDSKRAPIPHREPSIPST